MLNIMALHLAPLAVLANKKFFLPITKGLMLRSERLSLTSRRPSGRYLRLPLPFLRAKIPRRFPHIPASRSYWGLFFLVLRPFVSIMACFAPFAYASSGLTPTDGTSSSVLNSGSFRLSFNPNKVIFYG